jgi:hypothetical protein
MMGKTTSVSTPDSINTISHISIIIESSESPTFTTSKSTTISTQETLSLTASNEEKLLLKRKH